MKSIVILYHSDCWDGFGGAWAAWKKFGKKASYVGLSHDGTAGNVVNKIKNSEIYIIDFSFSDNEYKGVMKNLISNNKVIALDHHVSGEKATKSAQEYVYELNHSGAVIAWRYFHPQKKTPRLLLHIEDMDIWKFKLPKTKETFSYLRMFEYDFKTVSRLVKLIENPSSREEFVEKGGELLNYEKRLIRELIKNAELVQFQGFKTLAVNSPILMSEIGHELAKKMPPIGIIWNESGGMIKVSLRSNGKVDVSKIAQKFGGGGHKGAAGFGIALGKKLPWKVIKPYIPNSYE